MAEGLHSIVQFYAVDTDISGVSPGSRMFARWARTTPLVATFGNLLQTQHRNISANPGMDKSLPTSITKWTGCKTSCSPVMMRVARVSPTAASTPFGCKLFGDSLVHDQHRRTQKSEIGRQDRATGDLYIFLAHIAGQRLVGNQRLMHSFSAAEGVDKHLADTSIMSHLQTIRHWPP